MDEWKEGDKRHTDGLVAVDGVVVGAEALELLDQGKSRGVDGSGGGALLDHGGEGIGAGRDGADEGEAELHSEGGVAAKGRLLLE